MAKIKSKRIGIAIDMTPIVDVAFLLLIFFMTTTQCHPPEKEKITLPKSASEFKKPESNIITANVTSEGRIRLEYTAQREKKDQIVDASTFGGWLQSARLSNPSAYVLLKADKDAPYGVIEQIMKALQDQSANRFNIVTDAKKAQKLSAK